MFRRLPPLPNPCIVVDASIAAKWYMPDEIAVPLSSPHFIDRELIAPDILFFELYSLLCKRHRMGHMDKHMVETAIKDFQHMIHSKTLCLYPVAEYERQATNIAYDIKHPFYDCCYLALAQVENCAVITADKQLAMRGKAIHSNIILVE